MPDPSHYDVLQVLRTADPEIIRAAWRCLLERHGSDDGDTPGSTRFIEQVNDAWQTLADPARRRAYDAELLEGERRRELWRSLADSLLRNGLPRDACVRELAANGAPEDEALAIAVEAEAWLRRQSLVAPALTAAVPRRLGWRILKGTGSVLAWAVLLVVFGCLGLMMALPLIGGPPSGTRTDAGNCRVWRDGGVGEPEAARFADYLIRNKLDASGLTFQLQKSRERYEILVRSANPAMTDSVAVVFAAMGSEAAAECFDGVPTDVHACDSNFRSFRVFEHVPYVLRFDQIRPSMTTKAGRHALELENTSGADLSAVAAVVSMRRGNDGEAMEKVSWADWKAGEVKSLPLARRDFNKLEMTGNALRNGRKALIVVNATFADK